MDPSAILEEDRAVNFTLFHRALQVNDPISATIFFLVNAVIFFIACFLSRHFRVGQREERANREQQQQQDEENNTKFVEHRRNQLLMAIWSNDLATVLTVSNFNCPSDDDRAMETKKELVRICDENESEKQTVTSLLVPEGRDEIEIENVHSNCKIMAKSCHPCEVDCGSSDDEEVDSAWNDDDRELYLLRQNASISIPIVCPICLDHYKEGDTVVLSGNSSCSHGFHQHCILDYLVQYDEVSCPCPCCRQVFLPGVGSNRKSVAETT